MKTDCYVFTKRTRLPVVLSNNDCDENHVHDTSSCSKGRRATYLPKMWGQLMVLKGQ